LGFFRREGFSTANASAGAMNMGTLGMIFVLTLFLQSVQKHSPLVAGLAVIPLFAPLAVVAPFAGRLKSRIGPRLPIARGFCVAAIGLALLIPASKASGYLVLLPAFLLWGIGLGLVTPAVVAAAIAAVPGERAGLASAINNTGRQAGGAIGIAIAGANAGQPGAGQSFVSGFHAVAAAAACLYAIAAVAGAALIPGALWPVARQAS
jgi:DHA2 family methylenomycin A resistance protein-like MFS transporter